MHSRPAHQHERKYWASGFQIHRIWDSTQVSNLHHEAHYQEFHEQDGSAWEWSRSVDLSLHHSRQSACSVPFLPGWSGRKKEPEGHGMSRVGAHIGEMEREEEEGRQGREQEKHLGRGEQVDE